MRLLVCSLFILVTVVTSKEEESKLLGADDVDKKAALRFPDPTVETPKTLRDMKQLAKDDRSQLKHMQARARALKHDIGNKDTPKSKKKNLKKEFRELKNKLHSKKDQLKHLKMEISVAKKTGLHNGVKKGHRSKFPLNTPPFKLQTAPPSTSAPITKPSTTVASLQRLMNKKEARRKAQKKADRKANKKGRGKNKAGQLQSDQPVLPFRGRGRGHKHPKRVKCETDADCTETGAKCMTNRKGHKHCKIPGALKPAGKKCHGSEQCMRGLKCFVTKTPEMMKHKKHPRRGKGICADPATTDTSKGKFLDYKHPETE